MLALVNGNWRVTNGPSGGDGPYDAEPPGGGGDSEGDLATKERIRTKKPRQFKVVLHNDNYTTMEFVVMVLIQFFHKSETESTGGGIGTSLGDLLKEKISGGGSDS